MDKKRLVVAGIVAGLVLNILDFVTNGFILGDAWKNVMEQLHLTPNNAVYCTFWIVFDFIVGFSIAWMYSILRERCGRTVGTAIEGALFIYVLVHLGLWSHFIDKLYPERLLLISGAGELVSAVVAGLIARAIIDRK